MPCVSASFAPKHLVEEPIVARYSTLFWSMIGLSFGLHLMVALIGLARLEALIPVLHLQPDLPAINADLVPPAAQPEEALGEAMASPTDDILPPVDAAKVNSLKKASGKTLLNCQNCKLAGADFKKAYMRLASFQGSDLRKVDFSGADLTAGKFSRTNLAGANLTRANAAGIELNGANLQNADLSYARLDAAQLRGADLTGAKLVGTNLRLIEWVDGLSLRHVDARGAIFRFAFLLGVDFTGANLSGADFSRAKGLTNEQLSRACGDEKTRLPLGLVVPPCA